MTLMALFQIFLDRLEMLERFAAGQAAVQGLACRRTKCRQSLGLLAFAAGACQSFAIGLASKKAYRQRIAGPHLRWRRDTVFSELSPTFLGNPVGGPGWSAA